MPYADDLQFYSLSSIEDIPLVVDTTNSYLEVIKE